MFLIKELLGQRNGLIDELLLNQSEISKLRLGKRENIAEQLNEFQTPDMTVEITLFPDGDKSSFFDFLNTFSSLGNVHRNYRANHWPKLISDICTPILFVQNIFEKQYSFFEIIQTIEGVERSIPPDKAIELVESLQPFKENASAGVEEIDLLNLKNLLSIQEIEWDDKINILRNGHQLKMDRRVKEVAQCYL